LKRLVLGLGVAAVAGAALIGYLQFGGEDTPRPVAGGTAPPESAAAQSPESVETDAAGSGSETAASPDPVTPAAGDEAATQPVQPEVKRREQQAALPTTGTEEAAEGTAPTFDVVRVEPSGEAVIAGRAEPNSEVKVTLGADGAVGTTKADSSGAWAIVAEQPLAPGSHEIGIEAKAPDGGKQLSEDLVVVMVPEPAPASPAPGAEGAAQQQTGETAASGETPPVMAVLTPRDGGASKVLPQQPEEGIAAGGLVLDSVDYDETGRAILGGRAAPGARMLVYLDNKPIGEAIADADGRWALSPASPILEGLHDLRVDQLADDGSVMARVETPFSREPARQIAEGEDYVIVQPGNSLWRIARRTYGQGLRYSVIYQANADQIRDPDLIYPGQVFALPRVN